jgi:hypothetical protein
MSTEIAFVRSVAYYTLCIWSKVMKRYSNSLIAVLTGFALSYAAVSRVSHAQSSPPGGVGCCCGSAACSCSHNYCDASLPTSCVAENSCLPNTPPQGCDRYCGTCTNAKYVKYTNVSPSSTCQSSTWTHSSPCNLCKLFWCAEGQYWEDNYPDCGTCCPVTVWVQESNVCNGAFGCG